jgi:hypothetical protein
MRSNRFMCSVNDGKSEWLVNAEAAGRENALSLQRSSSKPAADDTQNNLSAPDTYL